MVLNQFFQKKGPFPLQKIIKIINCMTDFSKINDFEIYSIQSLTTAGKNDMTFLNSIRYKDFSLKTNDELMIINKCF